VGGSLVDASQTSTPAQWNRIARATVQERYRLGSIGHVEAGTYGETSADFAGRLAPRAGLVLHPWWGSTWKAVVARGFRDPSLFELAGAVKGTIHAETIDDAEMIASQKVNVPIASRVIPIETFGSVFYDECRGFLARDSAFFFHNDSRVTTALGATGGAQWVDGHDALRADISTFAQYQRPGDRALVGSPAWLAHVNGSHRFGDHVSASVAFTDVGPRESRDGVKRLNPYVLVDASIALVKIAHRIDVRVTGTNLLDSKYTQPQGADQVSPVVPGRSRSFFGEVRGSF
jgi:hypothetical protein